jgi:hypothetical protein
MKQRLVVFVGRERLSPVALGEVNTDEDGMSCFAQGLCLHGGERGAGCVCVASGSG